MQIIDIADEKTYEMALKEIESLMKTASKLDTPEGKRLDALATLVAVYEDKYYPIGEPSLEAMAQFERKCLRTSS